GSKPYGPPGQQRLPTPRPQRRIGPACSAPPSPRPAPAGRGRDVRRPVKNPARLMVRNGFDCCSLSHGERVRVRGNHRNSDPAYQTISGTVERGESSGRAGGFSNDYKFRAPILKPPWL